MSRFVANEEFSEALRLGQKEYKEASAAGKRSHPLVLEELWKSSKVRSIDRLNPLTTRNRNHTRWARWALTRGISPSGNLVMKSSVSGKWARSEVSTSRIPTKRNACINFFLINSDGTLTFR